MTLKRRNHKKKVKKKAGLSITNFFLKNKMNDKFNLDLTKIFELNRAIAALRDRYIGNSVQNGRLKNRISSKHLEMNKRTAVEAQYKTCARRYATSIDYLNAILVQDVVVYRIQFKYRMNWKL